MVTFQYYPVTKNLNIAQVNHGSHDMISFVGSINVEGFCFKCVSFIRARNGAQPIVINIRHLRLDKFSY